MRDGPMARPSRTPRESRFDCVPRPSLFLGNLAPGRQAGWNRNEMERGEKVG